MNIRKCSACGGDHKDVGLTIEKRIGGQRWFDCPTNGKRVYVVETKK